MKKGNSEPLVSRTSAGHTQREAAEVLGIPYRTWQDWEQGRFAIPAPLLKLYRHLAGVQAIPFTPSKKQKAARAKAAS